ncbi:hypothetical protein PR048_027380 [Dryococelus australis]|uniref:Uncharacterized protein n=1 Tax=Dryococelus australis TaxID=614101 RepID=A0ABQ9GGC6_9NEOP|nr:hypothetical protein PR048_027380 [Dryococelus australis]
MLLPAAGGAPSAGLPTPTTLPAQFLINSEMVLLETELSETVASAVQKILKEEIPKIGNRLLKKIPYKYFISD